MGTTTRDRPPAPSGATGARGLSRVAVWLLKLSIEPRYIPPASPQDNGRHVRMHRTSKAETTKPEAVSWQQQQVRFNQFRVLYTEERPRDALDQTLGEALAYVGSSIEVLWYDADHEERKVRHGGETR